ncbi:MAG: CocE/NonD family hydrolase, partial [Actinomycetota bacterium]
MNLTRMVTRSLPAVLVAALLVVLLPPATPAHAGPNGYVTMSDGIKIAVNIRKPDNYIEGKSYPTVFEMSGYDGGSADGDDPSGGRGSRYLTEPYQKDYFTIHASVRGTGCSGGEFDLFSWRSALDGYEVIEWINDQPWSNGEIAIYGHSYGGITGTMIAATRPPSLDAVTVSGLIDDLYRGIVYPGGVSNYGFPLLWTGAIRPVYDIGGGTFDGLVENQNVQCGENLSTRGRTILNDPIVQGLQDTDNEWFRSRSLITYIERINVPIHMTGAFNDEQTGPRGPYNLFDHLPDVPRRLVQTNGDHGTQTDAYNQRDRKAWVDHWLGVDTQPQRFGSWPHGPSHSSVLTRFENPAGDKNDDRGYNLETRTWPLEGTKWTDVYLDGDGSIVNKPPKHQTATYVSGSGRQAWSYQGGHTAGSPLTTADGPDELSFASAKFDRPTAIAGPIMATLYASISAPDTEFFVQLID